VKQVVQDLRSRAVSVEEVPAPCCLPRGILVKTAASLISCGTERAMVSLGAKNLFGKALDRPDLVRKFFRRAWRDGLADALSCAQARLETAVALGYSAAGTVLEAGAEAEEFAPGDRVACAGAGYAGHAEINWIPQNLCAKIPPAVDFGDAATAAVCSIALQAVRVADAKLGERVAVIGLGLVGQIIAQILRAAGCTVWGLDPDPDRVRRARELGTDYACENRSWRVSPWAEAIRLGQGMDVVIVSASTRSSEPVELAGEISRDRAVIVIVGDVRVDLPREAYYRKELQVRYSRSYGPGRYDPAYEQRGNDYPYGFVRWTEKRNLEACLDLLAAGKLRVGPLITHRFAVDDARQAYELLTGANEEKYLGILLTYSGMASQTRRAQLPERTLKGACPKIARSKVRIGWIGAGRFSRARLLPALRKIRNVECIGVANATGISACRAARDFGFRYASTDGEDVLNDPEIDAVFIATRHHLHAPFARAALERGKHAFVEKPLCVNETELSELAQAYAKSQTLLSVGFNRRFSPFARECADFFAGRREPLTILYRINAGTLPPNHWIFDPEQGHGRLIGEICHFVDFAAFLADSQPHQVQVWSLSDQNVKGDNLHVHLTLADGSRAEISYVSSGDAALPKERIEVFAQGRTAISHDFSRSFFYHNGRCRSKWALHQDKGHRDELLTFLRAVTDGGRPPIPFESLYAVMLATFRIRESLSRGSPVAVFQSCCASE
jgi:predicted dehydrogenase